MVTSDINDTDLNSLYNFKNSNYYNTVFLNKDSSFTNPYDNIFTIEKSSFSIDIGDLESTINSTLDIQGIDRSTSPDLGAFEYFQENE